MVSSATSTTTTAAGWIPELWAPGTLDAVEFAAQMQKRVTRDYDGVIKNAGNTVHVARNSNLTTQSKSTGISNLINWEAITEGKQDITVSTWEYAAALVEDMTEIQATPSLLKKKTDKLGYALARGREVTLAALPQSLSNIVGTLGNELTTENYLSAYQNIAEAGLLEASSDPGEDFSVFLSPAAYVAALKVDQFINSDYNPKADAINRAMLGNIYGFPVYVSNLMRSPATGQHECVMMHKGCFALVTQRELVMKAMYIIENFADGVAAYNIYGTAELNYPPETPGGGSATDNRGVLLRTV